MNIEVKYYIGDIEPDEETIFVFGSNPKGINGNPSRGTGGAALIAQLKFGVRQGEKMINCLSDSRMAYGLVTVKYPGGRKTLTPEQIKENFKILFLWCDGYRDKKFKLAYRNTEKRSLNGYKGIEMIEMLADAVKEYGGVPDNFYVSEEWKPLLEKSLNAPSLF